MSQSTVGVSTDEYGTRQDLREDRRRDTVGGTFKARTLAGVLGRTWNIQVRGRVTTEQHRTGLLEQTRPKQKNRGRS